MQKVFTHVQDNNCNLKNKNCKTYICCMSFNVCKVLLCSDFNTQTELLHWNTETFMGPEAKYTKIKSLKLYWCRPSTLKNPINHTVQRLAQNCQCASCTTVLCHYSIHRPCMVHNGLLVDLATYNLLQQLSIKCWSYNSALFPPATPCWMYQLS